ncbi:LysR family transcriptional regulator [Sporosarcina soli]|uniref:LysR family transcriptional regulator n=1 Tax=Sporosarcina soli TaxID=334736 RepID=A0ABW0TPU0_9BACL
MTISRYEIFDKVIELKSFTKAADALSLTQPGISHAIKSLETEWGIPLITRSRSDIQLTSDGERIIWYIRDLLRIHEEIEQEVAAIKGLEVGTVKVGTFTSVASHWLPKIIKLFQNENPNIDIKLLLGSHQEIENALLNNEIDCGIIALPTLSKTLNVMPLKEDSMLCIVSKENPLHKQKKILFSQIEKEPFIILSEGGDIDVMRIFNQHHIRPTIKYELDQDKAIISMVRDDLGISILSEMALSGYSEVISVLELEVASHRLIGLATTSTVSPATKKFIEMVKTWVEENA